VRNAKIAIYGGGGAPYHHIGVFARAGHSVSILFPSEVRPDILASFDAFVIPGGGYDGMRGQIDPLGKDGVEAIAQFVEAGGMYLGSCAGAYDAATPAEAFRLACPLQRAMTLSNATVWNEVADPWSDLQSPGVGRLQVLNRSPEHLIMRGIPSEFEIVHYNGPLFEGAESLFSIGNETEAFTPSEGFFSSDSAIPRMIDRAREGRVSGGVVERFGRGRAVLFGSHPEFGFSLTMDDEQLPQTMLLNAIDWQLLIGPEPVPRSATLCSETGLAATDHGTILEAALTSIRGHVSSLQLKPLDEQWIDGRYAMSVFGQQPKAIWSQSLMRITELADEIERLGPGIRSSTLSFRQPGDGVLDYGFHGVLALLQQIDELLSTAEATWHVPLGDLSADPYKYIRSSPYHLVAGSYLAAIGRATAAAILCRYDACDVNRSLT
jgi:glutamine amidotransferase-like uncharacterized protein